MTNDHTPISHVSRQPVPYKIYGCGAGNVKLPLDGHITIDDTLGSKVTCTACPLGKPLCQEQRSHPVQLSDLYGVDGGMGDKCHLFDGA